MGLTMSLRISPRETGSSARFPKLVTLCEHVARYALALVPLEVRVARVVRGVAPAV